MWRKNSKHRSTNVTLAKFICRRKFRTTLDLLRPDNRKSIQLKKEKQFKNFIGNRNTKFEKHDVVMAKDFRNRAPKTSKAKIVEDLSPRS